MLLRGMDASRIERSEIGERGGRIDRREIDRQKPFPTCVAL